MAADSTFWQGADLAHVICEPSAGSEFRSRCASPRRCSSADPLNVQVSSRHIHQVVPPLPFRSEKQLTPPHPWADLIVHTDLHPDSSVRPSLLPLPQLTNPTRVAHSTEQSLTTLFTSLLPRLHVLIIGPGLGRSPSMQLAARVALTEARKKGVWVVIDADGLWLVQSDPSVVKGYEKAVLTPNVVEFARLCEAVVRFASSLFHKWQRTDADTSSRA